jgi:hypothetical protein
MGRWGYGGEDMEFVLRNPFLEFLPDPFDSVHKSAVEYNMEVVAPPVTKHVLGERHRISTHAPVAGSGCLHTLQIQENTHSNSKLDGE